MYLTSLKRCLLSGLSVSRVFSNITKTPDFLTTLKNYDRANINGPFSIKPSEIYPMLGDFEQEAGSYRGHYFYQDLWAARKIYGMRPEKHLDIGSRIDGFIAHLLVFMPVVVLDIRDIKSNVEGLSFCRSDATSLSEFDDDSVESLSSLHAVEHFGLGRYGDPVDPESCFKVMQELCRVLKPGGRLYFSVPVGKERVQFNAHRIFSPLTILKRFNGLKLVSFSAVNDSGEFDFYADTNEYLDSDYSCGLFEFTK